MTYRPLNHNETVIVERTLYDLRGLGDGAAMSLRMAFTAFAMREDRPEFDVFQDSERERLNSAPIDKTKFEGTERTESFFYTLDKELERDIDHGRPSSILDWFFGDESLLDAQHKRLRLLFMNSRRYREQVLFSDIQRGTIAVADLNDLELIKTKLEAFKAQYPGTRQGVITHYEIFFGDPSEFSYMTAMERYEFHTNPDVRRTFLEFYRLPVNWSVGEIKHYLQERALANGSLTQAQIDTWSLLH